MNTKISTADESRRSIAKADERRFTQINGFAEGPDEKETPRATGLRLRDVATNAADSCLILHPICVNLRFVGVFFASIRVHSWSPLRLSVFA
jgi:hypothetical protein